MLEREREMGDVKRHGCFRATWGVFWSWGKRYPVGVEKGGAMERDKKKEEMRERGSHDLKFKASCICHLTTHENILVF